MSPSGSGLAFVSVAASPFVRPSKLHANSHRSLSRSHRTLRRPRFARASLAQDRTSLQDVSEKVIRAVERLGGGRVTVSDVAASAGVGLESAERDIVLLASLTGAAIDVTDSGDVAYRFARDVRGRLRASSLRASLRMTWNRVYPFLFSGVRIGFGALLIISIVVTFVAIAALSSSSNSRDDDRRSGGGGGMAFRMFTPNIFDVMWYSRSSRYYNQAERWGQPKPEMSFLEAVYSFVFGDGDPNVDIEERQWKTIAAVINANSGSVTAEQLRPFLLSPKAGASGSMPDESDILPVLTHFSGHPEVTPDGDIIYVFPNFSTTGGGPRRVEFAGMPATQLSEQEATFSRATASQRAYTIGLGILNLFGAVTLGGMLANARALGPDAAALLALLKGIYPFIAAYAFSFAIIPAVRVWLQRRQNRNIRLRNQLRMRAAAQVAVPSADVRRKLKAAARYQVEKRAIGSKDVVYSTDMDIDTIEQKRQQQLAEEFDRQMEER